MTILQLPLLTAERVVRGIAGFEPDLILALALETVLAEYDDRDKRLTDTGTKLAHASAARDSLQAELELARQEVRSLRDQLNLARHAGIRLTIAEARSDAGVPAPIRINPACADRTHIPEIECPDCGPGRREVE